MSLLEKIRSGEPDTEAWVFGFDPDINHAGYCGYKFRYSNVGKITPLEVHMGVVVPAPGTKRMAKAVSMSEAIISGMHMGLPQHNDCDLYALIEGQEIYHNAKDPLKTTVAKANDLMLLAYVSGAIVQRMQNFYREIDIKLVKPKEWKGNAKKEAMHEDFLTHINKSQAIVCMDNKKWDQKPPNIHTLDACCMCLKSANKIAKGTWT